MQISYPLSLLSCVELFMIDCMVICFSNSASFLPLAGSQVNRTIIYKRIFV